MILYFKNCFIIGISSQQLDFFQDFDFQYSSKDRGCLRGMHTLSQMESFCSTFHLQVHCVMKYNKKPIAIVVTESIYSNNYLLLQYAFQLS